MEDLAPERKSRSLAFRLPEPKKADRTVLSVVDLAFRFPTSPPCGRRSASTSTGARRSPWPGPTDRASPRSSSSWWARCGPTPAAVVFGPAVSVGYFSQHQDGRAEPVRHGAGRVAPAGRSPRTTEEELRSVLGLFMLGENYWDRPVSALSGGEKNRLALSSLFLARANLLILDEPTNHLDLESRAVAALKDYEGTMLVVAHDRHLLAEAADELWSLSSAGLEVFAGGYDEYERCRLEPAAPDQAECQVKRARRPGQGGERRQAELRNALYRELKPKRPPTPSSRPNWSAC